MKELNEFLQHLRVERGLSPRTWQAYGYQIRYYLRFLKDRGRTPGTASREDILSFIEARKGLGLSGSTLFATANAIRQFHRFLAVRGHARLDPTADLRLPKYHQRLPEPFSVSEMDRLLSVPVGNKFRSIRMSTALEVLYSTGMRISELLAATFDQLDLEGGWIRINGKGGRERVMPLGPRATEALRRYLKARDALDPKAQDIIFVSARGLPMRRTVFWRDLKRWAERAGVSGRVFPHRIRHSTASHLLSRGASLRVIQELLGHRSVLVTERYTHVVPEDIRNACRRAHPRF